MVIKRNTCWAICGLVLIIIIFFVFGTILFSHNCNKFVKTSCDDYKIYCTFNNYTINSDSCDISSDDDIVDDDIVNDSNNCYDLILNCTYTKYNLEKYCNIILTDFFNNDSAVDYFNKTFENQTYIAYTYNESLCTLEPIFVNPEITTFGLSLIILGFIVIIIYVYIMRGIFSEMCFIRIKPSSPTYSSTYSSTRYSRTYSSSINNSKNYKTIDNNNELPPKYSES
jgi:hypothetical protein